MTNPANPQQPALPGRLVQIAYRVDDLEAACRDWATKVGAGPFLVRSHLPVTAPDRLETSVERIAGPMRIVALTDAAEARAQAVRTRHPSLIIDVVRV